MLQGVKKYLALPPILVAPKPDEPLLLYVAAMTQVVSVVLVAEREEDLGAAEPKPDAGRWSAQHREKPPPPKAGKTIAEE
jgi:hypothetical protein